MENALSELDYKLGLQPLTNSKTSFSNPKEVADNKNGDKLELKDRLDVRPRIPSSVDSKNDMDLD